MNRIVLIGNGFDLAHGLKTSYQDFINWYWTQRVHAIWTDLGTSSKDCLCELRIKEGSGLTNWYGFFWAHQIGLRDMDGWSIIQLMKKQGIIEIVSTPFFNAITTSIEKKGWVDIETEYYNMLKGEVIGTLTYLESVSGLNVQLEYLQQNLVEYLSTIQIDEQTINRNIHRIIYEPINLNDISIAGKSDYFNHIDNWGRADDKQWNARSIQYAISKETIDSISHINSIYKKLSLEERKEVVFSKDLSNEYKYPDQIYLLSFNYTPTVLQYWDDYVGFGYNYIHGKLNDDNNPIIFGYGDELDDKYMQILNRNDNALLNHFKSIKYLEADNYKKVLSFMDFAPFQVYIMGHSCGNSDRTLLNTLFEHKNCVSIKPFYHIDKDGKDNYMEIVQNIARNFTDMKLMRDRVVNKTYTEAFSDDRKQ